MCALNEGFGCLFGIGEGVVEGGFFKVFVAMFRVALYKGKEFLKAYAFFSVHQGVLPMVCFLCFLTLSKSGLFNCQVYYNMEWIYLIEL